MRSWGYFRKILLWVFTIGKTQKNFVKTIDLLSLHSLYKKGNKSSKNIGSIAQLVQSICLTSRGSAVRTRVLPRNTGKGFIKTEPFLHSYLTHAIIKEKN